MKRLMKFLLGITVGAAVAMLLWASGAAGAADQACLRCHGQPGHDLSAAEAALLQAQHPGLRATGRQRGQVLGAWQLTLDRTGVAEFYTMKTRKKWKEHKMPKLF